MAESPNSGASESAAGVRRDSRWSEEYDRLPLKQRLKLLFTRSSLPEVLPGVNSTVSLNSSSSQVINHIVVKEEDDDSESLLPASFAGEEKVANLSSKRSQTGELKDQVTEANQMMNDTDLEKKVNVMGTGSFQQPVLSKNVVSSEVMFSAKSPLGSFGNCRNSLSNVDLGSLKVKTESPAGIFDDLDLVPLVDRQRALLSRQKMGLANSSAKGNSRGLSGSVDNVIQKIPKFVKEKNRCASKEFPAARNQLAENQKNLESSSRQHHQGCSSSPLQHSREDNRSTSAGNMTTINEKDTGSSLKKKFSGSDANVWKCPFSSDTTMLNPTIKTEPLEDDETIGDKTLVASLPSDQIVPVKYKYDMADDSDTDELDHMLLRERMKLFSKKVKVPSLEIKGTKCSTNTVPSGLDSQLFVSEAVKGLRSDRPRKRKKTATDSVETALDEDAPGLLQILIEKGVSVDEIKLYGQTQCDEDLDDLSCDESFSELESVIAKIFSQRTSLIKLAPLRYGKGERASYCLACLFSLVEQARYLLFRKWPVEWGWSRDLQSFIFVFERHNRIVLERPEYGYATYFFELVDSLPIDWQIKRLVIAMKLTSCSRVTLIENKALEVGEDLTEGEAKVLMDYGWIPNTGLGTMLNYCDRVVHDRKNERDTSEWRTKIGKLLADGYNGGTIVSANLPRKAVEYNFIQSPEVKLEVE